MKRHGFVTFWLWFGIVVNLIFPVFSVVTYQKIALYAESYVLVMQIVAALSGLAMILGYWKLLNWRKSGFWLNVCTGIVACIINIAMMYLIEQEYSYLAISIFPTVKLVSTAVTAVVSIFILWAILQLRKDGKSCWSQLK